MVLFGVIENIKEKYWRVPSFHQGPWCCSGHVSISVSAPKNRVRSQL